MTQFRSWLCFRYSDIITACMLLYITIATNLIHGQTVTQSLVASSQPITITPTPTPNTTITTTDTTITTTDTTITTTNTNNICNCNLNLNQCEANCCCEETDCSTQDREIFSITCPAGTQIDSALATDCKRADAVYIANYPASILNGIVCVQITNNPLTNYYSTPTIYSTIEQINNAISTPTQLANNAQSLFTFSYYRVGDPLNAIYLLKNANSIISYFWLPNHGFSSTACDISTPVKFFSPMNSVCNVQFETIHSICNDYSILDPNLYVNKVKILQLPYRQDSIDNSTVLISYTCINEITKTPINCTNNNLSIRYNGSLNSCYPILYSISYIFTINSTSGISSIRALLSLMELSGSSNSITQQFNVQFITTTNNDSEQIINLSGNPGYLNGHPILVSNGSSNNSSVITINDRLTILPNQVTCTNETRVVPGFRENTLTGCLYRVRLGELFENCTNIRNELSQLLLGNYYTHIGIYGNSMVNDSSAWIRIFEDFDSIESATDCYLYTKIRLDIVYAFSGPITNPTAQIIGAKYRLFAEKVSSLTCISQVCDFSQGEKLIFLTSEVEFIDASTAPVAQVETLPSSQSLIPKDFFYPLFIPSEALKLRFSYIVILLTLLVILLYC